MAHAGDAHGSRRLLVDGCCVVRRLLCAWHRRSCYPLKDHRPPHGGMRDRMTSVAVPTSTGVMTAWSEREGWRFLPKGRLDVDVTD